MTFRARNGEGAQAIHINRFAQREEGWAVYEPDTGSCEVVINTGTLGDGELALSVQSGIALLNGKRLEIEEQSIDVPTAQSEPRKDVIALTESGSLFRAGGDQALKYPESRPLLYSERPAPPDLREDPVVPLAVVAVPADVETISTNELRDVRPRANYSVGTINGTDPDAWVTSDELDEYDTGGSGDYLPLTGGRLTGDLTIDSGTTSDLFLANNGNTSLRVRARETGQIEWDVYNSNGTHIATPVRVSTNGVFGVQNGLDVTGDASFDDDLTVSQLLTANSTELTSVGEAGYSMGSGVHYSRDSSGRAVIYSVSSNGGDGWAFRDPDGSGDAVSIESNGNTTVSGALDADLIRQNGTQVLENIDILDSGIASGTATSLDFDSNIDVSVSNDTATISAAASGDGGGLSAVSISDDGSLLGEATEIDFGDYISARIVDNDVAEVTVDGAAYGTGGYGGGSGFGGEGSGGGGGGRSTIRAIDNGADPTGETASTAALQNAIDDAEPGDRVVWGESGTYYLDGEIEITKRIELDLHEGVVESDYHDGQAYPGDQNHYMPLFRVHGSLLGDYELQEPVDRGEDQVYVSTPGDFSVGDHVILRTSTPNQGTIPGYDYMATQTRIREIQDGVIYLEDNAIYDYDVGQYLTRANFVTRPILKNIHIRNRHTLRYSEDGGRVFGGFRHGIATEFCDQPSIENCTAEGYDSHLWSSRDDISPLLEDCGASRPMNLSGSCGEPIHIQSSRDVSIVRPTIKEARRAIDVRSGCAKVTVEEPDITGVSFVGISWHSTNNVEADIIINGGRVECKPDDPTHDNEDGSLDRRREIQQGRPFNTAVNGTLISNDVTYVGRIQAIINGPADITGGEFYKYRTAGTVLEIGGDDVHIDGTKIHAYGPVGTLVETDTDRSPARISMTDIRFDCSSSPTRAVDIHNGEEISISGTAIGSASGEVVQINGGSDITIDLDNRASGGTSVPGVRVGGGEDIDITGSHRGPGPGVLFTGAATGTSIREMRIEVTDGTTAAAVESDGSITGLAGVKIQDNDLRGDADTIVLNDDVTGFWATNNACSSVEYTTGTAVANVAGNMIY